MIPMVGFISDSGTEAATATAAREAKMATPCTTPQRTGQLRGPKLFCEPRM